jgi:NAD(P)-dependent dehydrogenase (short-subunit alcohol dehydrogenase family)
MRLKDKVALVTGAGAGIGRAIALRFAQEGASVVVADCDRSDYASREDTVKMITDAGGEASGVFADVSRATDAERMVKVTIDTYGKLDILVNNAGIWMLKPLTEVTEEEWDTLMAINLKGVFLGSKYAIPEMIKQGGGVIINMSSVAGYRGSALATAYCASKGGVLLLTRAMAAELKPVNIRVNALNPSIIDDGMGQQLLKDYVARGKALGITGMSERILASQGRLGTPEEVADAALFLASDEASFITGHGLSVDGGAAI